VLTSIPAQKNINENTPFKLIKDIQGIIYPLTSQKLPFS
jgi:hypothetical protein